jgi:DNA (cytosine-5)-methyltransferase 1
MPATDLAHPVKDRPLSIQEYIRLQQFPDDWKVAGGLADRYRQIGNAVPVGFAKVIGEMVAGLIAGHDFQEPKLKNRLSRYVGTDDVSWLEAVEKSDELALA